MRSRAALALRVHLDAPVTAQQHTVEEHDDLQGWWYKGKYEHDDLQVRVLCVGGLHHGTRGLISALRRALMGTPASYSR